MSRRCVGLVLCATFLLLGEVPRAQGQGQPGGKPPSLYQRLGGYDKLAAIFDDAAPKIITDPQLVRFFTGHATDSDLRQRQKLLELLCQDAGGPCVYTGRPLKLAHGGLGVGTAHFDLFLKHLTTTLDQLKIQEPEKSDVVALIGRYKADIVEKP